MLVPARIWEPLPTLTNDIALLLFLRVPVNVPLPLATPTVSFCARL